VPSGVVSSVGGAGFSKVEGRRDVSGSREEGGVAYREAVLDANMWLSSMLDDSCVDKSVVLSLGGETSE
jgi:hypothetical protein